MQAKRNNKRAWSVMELHQNSFFILSSMLGSSSAVGAGETSSDGGLSVGRCHPKLHREVVPEAVAVVGMQHKVRCRLSARCCTTMLDPSSCASREVKARQRQESKQALGSSTYKLHLCSDGGKLFVLHGQGGHV